MVRMKREFPSDSAQIQILCVDSGGNFTQFREGVKKNKKNVGLKHWILHKDQFKTHLFLQFFGGGTLFSLDPLKLSREAI